MVAFNAALPSPTSLLILSVLQHVSPLFRQVVATKRLEHQVLGTSMAWPDPYDARDVIHNRFQVTGSGRVIMVSPRFRPGVPFTLGSFRVTATRWAIVEPDVRPLPPDPRLHRIDGAEDDSPASAPRPAPLINIVDVFLDRATDVLWLLDEGSVNTMTNKRERVAPAKIIRLEIEDDDDDDNDDCVYDPKAPYQTFEIKTDRRAGQVDDTGGGGGVVDASCLQYLVTFQSRVTNGDHYAFVSDAARSVVMVLNTDSGDQWPIYFPERSIIPGATRDIMFMVTLRTVDGHAALYVTFMSGCRIFSVDLERLDQCNGGSAVDSRPSVVEVGRKPYQIVVLGSDAGSRMYFRRPTENEIWSWDVNYSFNHPDGFRKITVGNDCRAPVHVTQGYDGFVFVLANNFADYTRNTTGSLGAYTIVRPVYDLPPTKPDDRSSSSSTTTVRPTATNATDDDCECPP